jgi:hypothetical protein
MDISLNDQPVGSVFLDDSNAANGEWVVPLPQRALQAGDNQLEIAIEMSLPGTDDTDRCRLLDDKRLWTVVSSDSEISVPHAIVDFEPDLAHFAYPYGQRSGLGQSVFVLPDQPTTALVSDLLRLGVQLGALSNVDYLPAYVKYASEVDRESWQDSHLILLGRATKNTLLGELNSYLPRPFAVGPESTGQESGDRDVFAPVSSDDSEQPVPAAFLLDSERDTGVLQTVRSPWNQEKALLAVAGTTDRGVRLAIQALLEPAQNLEGNIAIIDLVSGNTSLIRVYSTDIGPANSTMDGGSQKEDPEKDAAPDPNMILLTQRWWK